MPEQGSSITSISNGLSSRQSSLLWMLAVAAEKNMPLVDEIDALADDERGSQRKRLRDLADMLRAGIPLPEAVENIPGLLPFGSTFAVRVGCETGRLGPALRSAANDLTSEFQEEQGSNIMYLLYCGLVASVLLSLTGFLMYWIVPKFAKIFEDFDMQLPEATIGMIEVSEIFVNYFYLFMPLLFAAIPVLIIVTMWGLSGGVRFLEVPAFMLRLFPRLETPQLLRNLSLVIDSGKPMVDAVSLAAYFYPRAIIRTKLAHIEVALRHAEDCFQQLRKHRLITKSEEQLLRSAEHVGNLSWALRSVATNQERRQAYRFRMVTEFFKPLAAFSFGLVVAAYAICFFMPLVALMDHLSKTSPY